MMVGLTSQFEGVLAAKKEGWLIFCVQIFAVFSSGSRLWRTATDSWTGWR